jgi:predicted protein tyrosine phosphatase
MKKWKILFVCTYNMMRSKTAEMIYKKDERFDVRSAGTDEAAEATVNREMLTWADHVVVMEPRHLRWLKEHYPDVSSTKKIHCLDIPDMYDFMETALIDLIRVRVENVFK